MFYQNKIMNAVSDYESSEYVIFGVPFDRTSSFRSGSNLAPDAIRFASKNFESYNPFFNINFTDLLIHDAGNIETYASINETIRDLFTEVELIVNDGKIPIMIGGEHSLSLPCIKACSKAKHEDFGVVILDAHLDLRNEYNGLKYNHACVSKHILTEVTDNYVSIGVRSGCEEEWEFAKENSVKYYTAEDVKNIGVKTIIEEVIEYLDCDNIYLSLDMDSIDCAYAPAVATPEPFGLNPREVREIIRTLSPLSIGFDIVEIAPEYDSGQTAILGNNLLHEFIASNHVNRFKD
ncbi:MAG: agmatinase [Methanosarcinaceae archaeon]|nr:agmatinase [Methanosarcinaceae archaeon]NKQ39152.1 agmatinase [Methanosarcinales archaeon]